MQHVDRKTRKGNKHRRALWIAAAALLLAGSVAAAVLLTRKTETEILDLPVTGGILMNRGTEEVESVTITRKGEESWTLTRGEDGKMHLNGEENWAAESATAQMLLESLANLAYEEVLTDNPEDYRGSEALFGLEEPSVTARARFSDGQEITIRLGDPVPGDREWYYMTVDGDDRLFAISRGQAEDLDPSPDILHPVNQPEVFAVLLDRITIAGADGNVTAEWRLRGSITDRDVSTNWEITVPMQYPADDESIETLKNAAEGLHLGIFVEEATGENLEKRGLLQPAWTLTLHMAAGSTGKVSGNGVYDVVERPESTVVIDIAESEDGLYHYVRFGNEIDKVAYMTLAPFLKTKPLDTAARYLFATPLNSLDSMTVEKNGSTTEYTLKREVVTDEDTGEARTACLRNGTEISWDAFTAMYDRLLTVNITGRLPADAETGNAHTKITLRTVNGGAHTIILSDWDGMHDAVTIDGGTLFYITRDNFSTAIPE